MVESMFRGGYVNLYSTWDRNQQQISIKPVADGKLDGRYFLIANNGMCPTAYVSVTQQEVQYHNSLISEQDREWVSGYNVFDIQVHGGCTFLGDRDGIGTQYPSGTLFVGWDYGHAGDRVTYSEYSMKHDKEWTFFEILEEIKNAIKILNERTKEAHNESRD